MLSRRRVGTFQGNELTRNLLGNAQPQLSQLTVPLWTDPGIKSGINVCKLISTSKKTHTKEAHGREWITEPSPKILATRKSHQCWWSQPSVLQHHINRKHDFTTLKLKCFKSMWKKTKKFSNNSEELPVVSLMTPGKGCSCWRRQFIHQTQIYFSSIQNHLKIRRKKSKFQKDLLPAAWRRSLGWRQSPCWAFWARCGLWFHTAPSALNPWFQHHPHFLSMSSPPIDLHSLAVSDPAGDMLCHPSQRRRSAYLLGGERNQRVIRGEDNRKQRIIIVSFLSQ